MIKGLFKCSFGDVSGEFDSPVLLSDAAGNCRLPLNLACGGQGTCGRCSVRLISGSFTDADGADIEASGQMRPSCKTFAASEFVVEVPPVSLLADSGKVLVNFENLPDWENTSTIQTHHLKLEKPTQEDSLGDIDRIVRACGIENSAAFASRHVMNRAHEACVEGDYEVAVTIAKPAGMNLAKILRVCTKDKYRGDFGVAIDIGTTSVVCALVDLADGRILDSVGSFNQQVRRCADVASRITAASSPDGLADMHSLIVNETLRENFDQLCKRNGLEYDDLLKVSVAGNTVMTHLLLGLDPRGLGAVPFTPVVNSPASMIACDMDLAANCDAEVIIAPAIGGYVGGDISADMVACEFTAGRGAILLVDIGTNAEIVASCGEKLLACAAPAGPAFEGQGTACGMRATSGAIDTIKINAETLQCECTTISNAKPVGICGSGYIDFIAQAYLVGIINMAGRFDSDLLNEKGIELTEITNGDSRKLPAFKIAGDVVITEADIAAILQAKGVIRAAIDTLLKRLSITAADLDRVYLAGGFARHLDMSNTLAIGMLPDIDQTKLEFIGNGSLAGAYLALMDSSKHKAMLQAAAAPEMVELNLDPDFQDAYIMSMMLGI